MVKGWIKFGIGLLLAPLAVGLALALYDLVHSWLPTEPWRSEWFWSLVVGAWVWVVIFLLMPRPLWFYVLGHELTHAVAVWLAGGRIYAIAVQSDGGYVTTDKVNWWIALSPYFVPFYTIVWLFIWISLSWYMDLSGYDHILFFGCGLTYAFHVTFTVTMLHPKQSDLINEGWVFSFAVIAVMNLLFLFLCFVPLAENVSWSEAFSILGQRSVEGYILVGHAIAWFYIRIFNFMTYGVLGGPRG